MDLASVLSDGRIAVPLEIRKKLRLKEGDSLLFIERDNGEVMVDNASSRAIAEAQLAFAGAAADFGVADETEVQTLIDEVRYGGKSEA